MAEPGEIAVPGETASWRARVGCDGSSGIRTTGAFKPSALGHLRVWLEIDEKGYVECGYCDKRFVLKGGPADTGATQAA